LPKSIDNIEEAIKSKDLKISLWLTEMVVGKAPQQIEHKGEVIQRIKEIRINEVRRDGTGVSFTTVSEPVIVNKNGDDGDQ